MTEASITQLATNRPRKMAQAPKAPLTAPQSPIDDTAKQDNATSPLSAKPQTKTALIFELLRRPTGADLDELVAATDWLPHTTRAALTGLRKKGHALISEKVEGVRRYRLVGTAV